MKSIFLFFIGVIVFSACCSKTNNEISDPGWNHSETDSVSEVKVVTYNIHYGYPVGKTSPDLKESARVLKSINPDIVFLQEVDIKTDRSGGVDQLAVLASLTGLEYYYFGKGIDYSNGEFGVAILSKYKLENTHATLLPLIPKQNKQDYIEQRVMAEARINIGGQFITVACTHLDLTPYNRIEQVSAIDSRLSTYDYPVILGGDFNSRPSDLVIAKFQDLSYSFTNLSGYSISNFLLDYIVYRPADKFKLVSHEIITSALNVSDHYPVVAVFELK
ncbi:hypothetical protein D1164_23150 [Mariniphaga sediminis]|uniref:Endonuclease/exonuclease/phosphatase domain-containing protein n=1 Tax=Mariniphaga sediminis TaxID=1628158 RepID=A0A399CWJ6_9BACT|nr:endonuclease/exonuclease/phosphatase family protein [Mariniphaga sediminis]RIH62781.1 hypothetical protein D1164_23150 [Mariniphaga sediminis]